MGLLLIFLLLKAVALLVNRFHITPLRSGEYGMYHLIMYIDTCALVCVCVCVCVCCRSAVPTALLAGPVLRLPGGHAGHEAHCRTLGCIQILEGGMPSPPPPRTLYSNVFPLPPLNSPCQVDEVILPTNVHLRIAIVMFIVPLVVNVRTAMLA